MAIGYQTSIIKRILAHSKDHMHIRTEETTKETWRAVSAVIAKHLPQTKRPLDQNLHSLCQSDLWSLRIISADVNSREIFGLTATEDVEALTTLERALREFEHKFKKLSSAAVREIDEVSHALGKEDGWIGLFVDVERFRRTLLHVQGLRRAKSRDGGKRDWRAVSVAKQCRDVWGREQVDERMRRAGEPPPQNELTEGGLTDAATRQRDEYKLKITRSAPRVDHNDRPGPFGVFLEEVFDAMDIHGRGGESIRAASALKSLKRAQV